MIIFVRTDQQSESEEEQHLFFYLNSAGTLLGTLDRSRVQITCLEYAPAIESIIIGYNFGGFQIWKLDSLQLE